MFIGINTFYLKNFNQFEFADLAVNLNDELDEITTKSAKPLQDGLISQSQMQPVQTNMNDLVQNTNGNDYSRVSVGVCKSKTQIRKYI